MYDIGLLDFKSLDIVRLGSYGVNKFDDFLFVAVTRKRPKVLRQIKLILYLKYLKLLDYYLKCSRLFAHM